MVARVTRQAVLPGSQYDWRHAFARLPKLVLFISAVGLLSLGAVKLNDPNLLPIQNIRAQGTFINLTEQMLLKQVGDIQGGYFNINVRAVQEKIESLAWVDRANVRRVWPDTLMITVTEQNATALWQGKGLVNQRGELFYPDKNTFPSRLPQLNGPADTHQQLLKHYRTMHLMLIEVGLPVQAIEMDARRSLVLGFDNGLRILLGRDSHYLRLERFIRMYKKVLVTEINHIQQIDMRYTNGFTLLRKQ